GRRAAWERERRQVSCLHPRPRTPVMTHMILPLVFAAGPVAPLEPIPDRLLVLTFDDASKSHFTVARPLLLKYKFGATFFVTEGWDFATNKTDYMTWEEIAP